jgi:hypothetical protein
MNAFQHLSRIATHLDYGRSHALLGSQYGCESTLRTKTVSVHIKELKVASSSRLRTKTRLPRSNAENVLVDCFAITDRRHD